MPHPDFPGATGYLNTASIGLPPSSVAEAMHTAVDDWAAGRTDDRAREQARRPTEAGLLHQNAVGHTQKQVAAKNRDGRHKRLSEGVFLGVHGDWFLSIKKAAAYAAAFAGK